jgi:hypothetical protein
MRRYLLGSLPALLLLASVGIIRVAQGVGAAIVALLLLSSIKLGYLMDYDPPRQDWRAAVALFEKNNQAGDFVMLYPNYMVTAWQYYYRHPITCLYSVKDTQSVDPSILSASRLWLIFADQSREVIDKLLDRLFSERWIVLQKQEFNGGMKVFILSRQ